MKTRVASLTTRQQECLKGKWERKLDKEIAHDLGISQRAVEEHLRSAREKIGVASTRSAVAAAAAVLGWNDTVLPNCGLPDLPNSQAPVSNRVRQAAAEDEHVLRDGGAYDAFAPTRRQRRFPMPLAVSGETQNDLDLTVRVFWPLAIAALVPGVLVFTLIFAEYAARLVNAIIRKFP